MGKSFYLSLGMLFCVLLSFVCPSCSKDEPKNEKSPIIGTWLCEDIYEDYYDNYTLVFEKNHTGYIRNEYGTRTMEQMNFDWSLTMSSNGEYLLSVIYKSGDRDIDGPFEGGYAQYNRTVTIAGKTLSIHDGDGYVMLFRKK